MMQQTLKSRGRRLEVAIPGTTAKQAGARHGRRYSSPVPGSQPFHTNPHIKGIQIPPTLSLVLPPHHIHLLPSVPNAPRTPPLNAPMQSVPPHSTNDRKSPLAPEQLPVGLRATATRIFLQLTLCFRNFRGITSENSIACGKSTSLRIYPRQHTPKIGEKLYKYGRKTFFRYLGWSF